MTEEHSHEGCHHKHEHEFESGTEPAVYSFQSTYSANSPYGETGKSLKEKYLRLFTELNDFAEHNNLLVGHIKTILEAGGERLWLTTTGDEINQFTTVEWDAMRIEDYKLYITVIVFGIEEKELRDAVMLRFNHIILGE